MENCKTSRKKVDFSKNISEYSIEETKLLPISHITKYASKLRVCVIAVTDLVYVCNITGEMTTPTAPKTSWGNFEKLQFPEDKFHQSFAYQCTKKLEHFTLETLIFFFF